MAKYHIGKDGLPHECHARKGNCPLASEGEHFNNIEDANREVQNRFEKEYSLNNSGLSTLSAEVVLADQSAVVELPVTTETLKKSFNTDNVDDAYIVDVQGLPENAADMEGTVDEINKYMHEREEVAITYNQEYVNAYSSLTDGTDMADIVKLSKTHSLDYVDNSSLENLADHISDRIGGYKELSNEDKDKFFDYGMLGREMEDTDRENFITDEDYGKHKFAEVYHNDFNNFTEEETAHYIDKERLGDYYSNPDSGENNVYKYVDYNGGGYVSNIQNMTTNSFTERFFRK